MFPYLLKKRGTRMPPIPKGTVKKINGLVAGVRIELTESGGHPDVLPLHHPADANISILVFPRLDVACDGVHELFQTPANCIPISRMKGTFLKCFLCI